MNFVLVKQGREFFRRKQTLKGLNRCALSWLFYQNKNINSNDYDSISGQTGLSIDGSKTKILSGFLTDLRKVLSLVPREGRTVAGIFIENYLLPLG